MVSVTLLRVMNCAANGLLCDGCSYIYFLRCFRTESASSLPGGSPSWRCSKLTLVTFAVPVSVTLLRVINCTANGLLWKVKNNSVIWLNNYSLWLCLVTFAVLFYRGLHSITNQHRQIVMNCSGMKLKYKFCINHLTTVLFQKLLPFKVNSVILFF